MQRTTTFLKALSLSLFVLLIILPLGIFAAENKKGNGPGDEGGGGPGFGLYLPLLHRIPSLPAIQVTTDPADELAPALVQTANGKLLTVFERNGKLWSRISADSGATWTAETQIGTGFRPSLVRAADGNVWLVYDLDAGILYRTSANHGLTWSAEQTIVSGSDFDPAIILAADGKLWIVWISFRSGPPHVYYRTHTSGGGWSDDTRLSTGNDPNNAPAITQTAGGRLVVIWNRGEGLWQRSSDDDGATWSAEKQIMECCKYYVPSLTAVGETLWLAYEKSNDIMYRTSTDQGDSWSWEVRFTRFVGIDNAAGLAALAVGKPGLVWSSIRSGNRDIWFSIIGEREDASPPPYIGSIAHQPECYPDGEDTLTFRASAWDETGVSSVKLVWTLNGTIQEDLEMYNDGAHDDGQANDSTWGVQHAPLSAGSQVVYSARAIDSDGNAYLYPGQSILNVQPFFDKTADILFVADRGGDTSWLQLYYAKALDAQGFEFDIWDAGLRCEAPDSATLNQYKDGVIIWAAPDYGFINRDRHVRTAVQNYLTAGGSLFITGQQVAFSTQGTPFLQDYLHATYVKTVSDLHAVDGTAGDPIGDGLMVAIEGGDGANHFSNPDEVEPVAPAQAVFTYLAAPSISPTATSRHEQEAPVLAPDPYYKWPPAVLEPEANAPVASPGCGGGCIAGLRVDTGVYKVVYLAFGFEGINSALDRSAVMGRVMGWLEGSDAPVRRTPAHGQAAGIGDVLFTWLGTPGSMSYQIQIDAALTFDTTELVDEVVNGVGYRHNFASPGAFYWRLRALPNGEWATPWPFTVAIAATQITTNAANDTSPALVKTANGKLLAAFVRNGNLWSRASTDNGATWGGEIQIDGCCRYHPSLAQASEGGLWLAYDREGGIWYRTSADHGASWSAEQMFTAAVTLSTDPAIFWAADGRLWMVYQSYLSGAIWYATSPDGGATWSQATRLSNGGDTAPTITQTADGRMVVIWNHYDALSQRSSSDGGVTWSEETRIAECCRNDPGLAVVGDVLWLFYEQDGDIWYRTSSNGGDTWGGELRFTRFKGPDQTPAAAGLAPDRIGVAWQSYRSGNEDIWFGAAGEREDLSPPPYVASIEHRPQPNPDGDDPIIFRAHALDETGVTSVKLVWTLNGVPRDDLEMVDDGAHDDDAVGDGIWGVRRPPLAEGSQINYRVLAIDANGHSYRYPMQKSFKVLAPFVKTADILFVPDAGGANLPNDTAWFRPYYTGALDFLGQRYDTWDTALRGEPGSAILQQYKNGVVIWAVPYWGYVTAEESDSIDQLQAYLDAGGRLFLSGQNVAESLAWTSFLTNYLHATFRQANTGMFAVAGAGGDAVGDGLTLNLSGGDGANNQYSNDEIDPIAPAKAIFTYQSGAMLAAPIRPADAAPVEAYDEYDPPEPAVSSTTLQPDGLVQPFHSPFPTPPAPAGCAGSCTAGLRVSTGAYKLVYFAFGFEAINSAADRQTVLARVLDWLKISDVYMPMITR